MTHYKFLLLTSHILIKNNHLSHLNLKKKNLLAVCYRGGSITFKGNLTNCGLIPAS